MLFVQPGLLPEETQKQKTSNKKSLAPRAMFVLTAILQLVMRVACW